MRRIRSLPRRAWLLRWGWLISQGMLALGVAFAIYWLLKGGK